MKAYLLTIAILAAAAVSASGQFSRTNRIFRPCASTTTPASVAISSVGAITLTPCATQPITLGTSSEGIISVGQFNNYIDFPDGDIFQIGGIVGGLGAALWVDRVNNKISFSSTSMDWSVHGPSSWNLRRTITTAGTTGNQTINLINGTVNFAAAATTITVTNSTVSATSQIIVTPQRLDGTCRTFVVDAKGAGTFNIVATAACTAETSVAFWVTN